MPTAPQARLTIAAEFPERFFLESLAVRADGSMLITVRNRKELWFVPAPADNLPVQPRPLTALEKLFHDELPGVGSGSVA